MARRTRDSDLVARRRGRARRKRPSPRWGAVDRRAGAEGRKGPPTARVVPLTAARRRAAARRRLDKATRAIHRAPSGSTGTSNDFHLAACIACARAGGRVLMDYWGKSRNYAVREKGRNDYVTVVDREAEESIVRIVRDRFPDHAIMAEESPPSAGRVGYRWYIDPLDGTTNFIHGYPLFAVSVGVADPQGMRAAAVFDPVREEMFTAARGQGAFLNGEPIHASAAESLAQSLVVTGIPFRSLARLDEYLASFRAFILGTSGIRRDGSAALNLAYVACGRYDGFWEMSLSPWDVAAGSLIVQEAGGLVTDFRGRDRFIESGDIIAANRHVHAAMLRNVREAYRRDD
jgi:myo-inositol-1(or 4)-monophosphatase